MASALSENGCVEDDKASQQQQDPPQPGEEEHQAENEHGTEEVREQDGAEDEGEELDESCASSTMHKAINTGQMNGGTAETPTNESPKTPSKSIFGNRTGRRNQELKERSSFICPLCEKNCLTLHQFTMHIRQHNTAKEGSDHSCSICGKALSSASSLDRHMLVHSGERPYKCRVCGQTFTTNGNMHRHMKIHDKDPNSAPASRPTSPNKRGKQKRKPSLQDEVEKIEEPSNKKVLIMQQSEEQPPAKREEDLLHCPICFKTFICKYGLESHMETHPDTALRCNLCCITFRTHRSLLRHNSVIHKQLPTDPTGRPFIQTNPSIPLGFSDLSFIDFSCHKFPQIAQIWCETNLRRCSSKFHRFVCEVCNKAFPLQVSLELHKADCAEPPKQEAKPISDAPKISSNLTDSKEFDKSTTHKPTSPVDEKDDFMESLGLQLSSRVKPRQSEEEIQQEVLDSIRFIRVDPSSANLPQETNSNLGLCLLDPASIQGLNKGNGLSLVSLHPLQGGLVVRPVSQAGVELADIQQILKMAASVPSQVTFPLLPKAPGSPQQAEPKQISPPKSKPLVAPRSSMGTSTPPPPVMNAQQASSGCVSPGLPPPATSKQSSNIPSSSTSSSPVNWETTHLGGDRCGAAVTQFNPANGTVKQDEVSAKDVRTSAEQKAPKTEYICRVCSKVFFFAGGLQAHMRGHFLESSPYKCSMCTYAAPDNATLMRHLRTHSGERPYVCRICHYPFTVKANCERHLRKKHTINNRRDIEKNIEYVTPSSSVSGVIGGTTLDLSDSAGTGTTTCQYCGEDLKSYRALQIHLRTHNGCQRKPFECRQCGAAFLTKRNCIHHLMMQHTEIKEMEIEDHVNTLVPLTAASSVQAKSSALVSEGVSPSIPLQSTKQGVCTFSKAGDQDEPLDFSNKTLKTVGSDKKPEPVVPSLSSGDCSMEPIDLSMPKNQKEKVKKEPVSTTSSSCQQEITKEITSSSSDKSSGKVLGLHVSLPMSTPSLAFSLTSDLSKHYTRLKPLLPKPASASNTTEMPPLASIAQIISSVSAAPVLLKTGIITEKSDVVGVETLIEKKCSNGTTSPEPSLSSSSTVGSKRRGRKRQFQEEMCDPTQAALSAIDSESTEEFPSVEKMLATTDANKFSPYLQQRQVEPEKEKPPASEEQSEGKADKQKVRTQSKGKKNAYSNSVQKMKCSYCPRVFPWSSSLQRHMLTHTGQKPFPCPQCDAFFSTKSNCERHLLRKHGMSNRSTAQSTGSHHKAKDDEGSQESADDVSDAERSVAEDSASPEREEKATPTDEDQPEQLNNTAMEEQECKKDPDTPQSDELNHMNMDITENSDDSQIEKSLDLSEPTEVEPSGTEEQQPEAKEPVVEPVVETEGPEPEEFPHTCSTCKKTFRHAATLSRHQSIHQQDSQVENGGRRTRHQQPTVSSPPVSTRTSTKKEVEPETEADEKNGSAVESGAEEDEEGRKEERNDEEEEGGSSETKGLEEEKESVRGRSDKRKKICSVCGKRFWSLQDLTRHIRSHTGERPYQCQTCDRTFTLKHSLVRHQRIHQTTPDGRAADRTDDSDAADGPRDDSAVDGSGSETDASPGFDSNQGS
ncbi:ras-responsive element-binding protein 1 [Trichomycterus rosablanca]|uniref:ras-responsive element-binding protein 1 n=1 Tax=Trichomycterus rosablanca TaxID=2290929 RepID=UPI002F354A4F